MKAVGKYQKTIENVFDEDKSLTKQTSILFCEQGITIVLIFTTLPITISTIAIAVIGVFGGRESLRAHGFAKDKGTLKKWLNRVVDGLKRFNGKDVEALSAIVENVVGAIFSFLGKADRLFIEHFIEAQKYSGGRSCYDNASLIESPTLFSNLSYSFMYRVFCHQVIESNTYCMVLLVL